MTREIDIAERQALASPHDWPQDFHEPHGWNICERCLKPFLGHVSRIQCRECANRHTLEDLK